MACGIAADVTAYTKRKAACVAALHDRAVHARFDSIEKRVDEIRKRLALEH